jgi:anthranilate synthase component 1
MDFAITIRTSLITKDKIIFQAGAGVVADSIPELEWLEVSNKLAANTSSFFDLGNLDD